MMCCRCTWSSTSTMQPAAARSSRPCKFTERTSLLGELATCICMAAARLCKPSQTGGCTSSTFPDDRVQMQCTTCRNSPGPSPRVVVLRCPHLIGPGTGVVVVHWCACTAGSLLLQPHPPPRRLFWLRGPEAHHQIRAHAGGAPGDLMLLPGLDVGARLLPEATGRGRRGFCYCVSCVLRVPGEQWPDVTRTHVMSLLVLVVAL